MTAPAVPPGWTLVPLKWVAEVRSGLTVGRDLDGHVTRQVPYLRVANVQDGYLDLSDMAEIAATSADIARASLKPGDVLMNEGGDNDKLGRGALWRGDVSPCLHQNHVFCVRPKRVEGEWITRCTQATYLRDFFATRAKQSTNLASISSSNIKMAPLLVPPPKTRARILAFLDRKTAAIDDLIAKKQRLIELLQEKRQALITQAVTKGLDPNVPMKDSGVEWIGPIKATWPVSSVGRAYEAQLGKMLQPAQDTPSDCEVPYVKALHVQWGAVTLADLPLMWASRSDIIKYQVHPGDLIVCEGGEVGRAAIVTGTLPPHTIMQNAVHRIRSQRNNVRFLRYVLELVALRGWLDVLCNKATIAHFTSEKLLALRVPLPSRTEQDEIVGFLEAMEQRHEQLGAGLQKSVDLLKEYRQALITAAVTGKLDIPATPEGDVDGHAQRMGL